MTNLVCEQNESSALDGIAPKTLSVAQPKKNPARASQNKANVHTGLALLDQLDETDWDWIFDHGNEEQVIANTHLIHEGDRPDAVYFVLEGLAGVFIETMGDQPLAKLGPGEIFGEIAFLKNQPATATIRAIENTLVLGLPWSKLEAKLGEDRNFAAGFYRALSLMNVDRLKNSLQTIGSVWDEKDLVPKAIEADWDLLASQLEQFKELMIKADKQALKNGGEIPPVVAEAMNQGLGQFADLLNTTIGDQAGMSEVVKNELGARVQRELLPYILMSEIGERIYAKPRGYAGDFYTIELMYRDDATGSGRLGPAIDRAIRNQKGNLAVMNRRGLLAEEINKTIQACDQETARVTSLASGPAAELFDVFEGLDDPNRLKATCIDIDLQALAFVGDKRDERRLRKRIDLHNGNLVYLATGRQKLELPPQDLIYSIGLIDYFSDKFVVMLLNYVHRCLKPGGKIILGNFHPDNPNKAFMDHVLDWKLIHRDEKDMDRLFQASAFARGCTRIRFEKERVNLFAECIKQP